MQGNKDYAYRMDGTTAKSIVTFWGNSDHLSAYRLYALLNLAVFYPHS